MFLIFALPVLFLICALAAYSFWSRWKDKQIQETEDWPNAEATIQQAELQKFGGPKSRVYFYPCFAFSYPVGDEYCSGRFGLAVEGDEADRLIREMIDRKLSICYKPEEPSVFYIPDEQIEGYDVLQERSPDNNPYYPTD